MPYLGVVPRHGQDYKSRTEVLAAWNANEDFMVADALSQWDGKPVSKSTAERHACGVTIQVRYADRKRVLMIGNRRRS